MNELFWITILVVSVAFAIAARSESRRRYYSDTLQAMFSYAYRVRSIEKRSESFFAPGAFDISGYQRHPLTWAHDEGPDRLTRLMPDAEKMTAAINEMARAFGRIEPIVVYTSKQFESLGAELSAQLHDRLRAETLRAYGLPPELLGGLYWHDPETDQDIIIQEPDADESP